MVWAKSWMAGSIFGIVGAVSVVAAASGSAVFEPRAHEAVPAWTTCFEEAVVYAQMDVVTVQMAAEDEALKELLVAAAGHPTDALLVEMQARLSALWAARTRATALLDLVFRSTLNDAVPQDCRTERWPRIS